MFLFRKKNQMPLESKRLLDFYNDNKNLFGDFETVSERKKIVKEIYDILKYTGKPGVISKSSKPGISVYRGISADDVETLKAFSSQFVDGEAFYGKNASIYGTGIYTVVGDNKDVAYKYATEGYTTDNGIVIEGKLDGDARIIKIEDLYKIKETALEKLKTYPALNIFLKVLEDDGAFAAILGYQAIYVEDKKYMVILDRTQLAIDVQNMVRQLAELTVSEKRR